MWVVSRWISLLLFIRHIDWPYFKHVQWVLGVGISIMCQHPQNHRFAMYVSFDPLSHAVGDVPEVWDLAGEATASSCVLTSSHVMTGSFLLDQIDGPGNSKSIWMLLYAHHSSS
jgi:hypothetical protein